MLAETALPYVVKFVEPRKNEVLNAEFSKISPNGTTPAIVDTGTGTTLFESGAILYFLAEKSGKLLPAHLGTRADAIKWLMFEVANVCPTMIELHHYVMNDSGEFPAAIFQRYKRRLAHYCSILDKQLEDRDYLAGEYSIADIALYPWMVTLEDMAEINLGDYPNLNSWAKAISDRSAAQLISQTSSQNTNWCYRNGRVELCHA
jgi:GST-like protein